MDWTSWWVGMVGAWGAAPPGCSLCIGTRILVESVDLSHLVNHGWAGMGSDQPVTDLEGYKTTLRCAMIHGDTR